MPFEFGDIDPEDSWDDADPLQFKLGVLIRWAVSVRLEHLYGETPRVMARAAEARAHAHALQGDHLRVVEAATLDLIILALAVIP